MPEGPGPILKAGDTVEGRYRVVKALDEGGMGTVFLAEHVLIKRKVALKVMRPELAADPDVVERFMNEARAAGTLGHPNIVESTDMGFTREGVPFIVFEFLEGTLLVDEVYRLGGLPVRRALRIANQIASALHAAHQAGIVHRDLKSENVFLTDKDDRPDHVKVLDFGISRFQEAESDSSGRGMIMGTPEFMAPEQITAPDSVDRRADIYALGVIMYEMLSARRPFRNDADPQVVLQQVVHDVPPPLTVSDAPPGLTEMIVEKLLAKDPAKRYPTMKELQGAIEAFYNVGRPTNSMTPLSVPIPPTPPETNVLAATNVVDLPRREPARRSRRPWLWLAAAVCAAAAGLVIPALRGHASAPAAARPAAENAAASAALQGDAAKLADAIENQAHATHLRAESLASSPVLRAAIETDAPTIRDAATNEHLFTPAPGETLEIFQLVDGRLHAVVHLPDGARPVAPLDGKGTRVEADGSSLVVVAGTVVTKQDGQPGGAIALASKLDLGDIRRSVADHALAATLTGLAQPVALADRPDPGTSVHVPVPVGKDVQPSALGLDATVATPKPQPAVKARSGAGYGMVSYAFWGIGGVLLVLFLGNLIRGRREG